MLRAAVITVVLCGACRHHGPGATNVGDEEDEDDDGYQPEVTKIGDGRLMIRSAPGEQSPALATQHAYRRAHGLCPGGYEVLEDKPSTTRDFERVGFARRAVDLAEVLLVIRCTAKQ